MATSEFNVEFTTKSVVKASDFSREPYIIHFSNLDILSGRSPVTILFFYAKPQVENFSSILSVIKTSLSKVLNHYHPFAGRIVPNPVRNEPELLCNNEGVEVMEAYASIDLASLNFYDINKTLKNLLVQTPLDIPLRFQVTSFTCGGFSISLDFDHIIADAAAFAMFLVSFCQIAREKPISVYPNHERSNFQPRSPPTYGPLLDRNFTKCTVEMILSAPKSYDISVKRLYFIESSDVLKLQEVASENGESRTKHEAFSAYLWRLVASALKESDTRCNMGWMVDGRGKMVSKAMSNFIGNVVSMAVGEADVEELNQATLSDVASLAHKAITEVTNEKHFLDLIDWIECHKPGMFAAKMVLGITGPAVIVSSARHFPLTQMDLGFGIPVLGTCYSAIPSLGAAYINPQPSSRGDGSWVVYAMVWPELASALESDPNNIFKPITAKHLGLKVV